MQCRHTPQGGAPLQRWVEGSGNQALPGGQKKYSDVSFRPGEI